MKYSRLALLHQNKMTKSWRGSVRDFVAKHPNAVRKGGMLAAGAAGFLHAHFQHRQQLPGARAHAGEGPRYSHWAPVEQHIHRYASTPEHAQRASAMYRASHPHRAHR